MCGINEPKLTWKRPYLRTRFLSKILYDQYVETNAARYWVNWNWNTFKAEIWQKKPGERAEQVAEYELQIFRKGIIMTPITWMLFTISTVALVMLIIGLSDDDTSVYFCRVLFMFFMLSVGMFLFAYGMGV